jgi:hypothetical protein
MCSLVPYSGLDWLEEERELAVLSDTRADSSSSSLHSVDLPTGKGPVAEETVNGLQ